MKIKSLMLIALIVLNFGCKKSTTAATDTTGSGSGSTGSSSKATLSSWHVSNSAWAMRFDVAGNTSGANFTLTVKFSDNSEIHCTNTQMAGTSTSGTYNAGTCSDVGGGTYGTPYMSTSTGASTFDTGGAGTYSNTGSTLILCKNNSTCNTYY